MPFINNLNETQNQQNHSSRTFNNFYDGFERKYIIECILLIWTIAFMIDELKTVEIRTKLKYKKMIIYLLVPIQF